MGPAVPITADLSLGLMVGAHAALSASEGVPAGLLTYSPGRNTEDSQGLQVPHPGRPLFLLLLLVFLPSSMPYLQWASAAPSFLSPSGTP